jgi:hypothetical protein
MTAQTTMTGVRLSLYAKDLPNITLATEFANRIIHQDQQMDMRVAGQFTPDFLPVGSKEKWYPFINKVGEGYTDTITSGLIATRRSTTEDSIEENRGRYQETKRAYMTTKKRVVTTSLYTYVPTVERADLEARFANPMDAITTEAVAAFQRKKDSIAITALGADVTEGYDDETDGTFQKSTVSFNSNYIVNADTPGAFNVDLMLEAYRIWDTYDVNYSSERPVLVIGPYQKKNIMKDDLYVHGDYNPNQPLHKGMLDSFMNASVVVSNLLSTTSEGYRKCFLFLPSGMRFVQSEEFFVSIDDLPDWNHQKQIYMEHSSGAVRLVDTRVLMFYCTESSGSEV